MKVIKTNDVEKSQEILRNKVEKSKSKGEKSGKSESESSGVIVNISKESEILYKAKKEIDKLPEVRIDKVEEIKEKIENKEYRVDEDKVADKILEESIIDELV